MFKNGCPIKLPDWYKINIRDLFLLFCLKMVKLVQIKTAWKHTNNDLVVYSLACLKTLNSAYFELFEKLLKLAGLTLLFRFYILAIKEDGAFVM